jgi:hypothetical protein
MTKILALLLFFPFAAQAQAVYSQPDASGNVAAMKDGKVMLVMPNTTAMYHVDLSESFVRLYPGSCIAAAPAKCQTEESSPQFPLGALK